MKEVEATDTELAKFKANSETIQGIQRKLVKLQKQLQAYSQQQEQLADTIRERVEDCPDTPLDEWDFSEVDWLTYSGKIKIPEPTPKEGEEDRQEDK